MKPPFLVELNIEQGKPRAFQAKTILEHGLLQAKRQGAQAVRVIHGYGSSGPGGSLKYMTHQVLQRMLRDGDIKAFVPGEQFSIFEEVGRALLDAYPALSKDRDLGRNNRGITLVLLNRK